MLTYVGDTVEIARFATTNAYMNERIQQISGIGGALGRYFIRLWPVESRVRPSFWAGRGQAGRLVSPMR